MTPREKEKEAAARLLSATVTALAAWLSRDGEVSGLAVWAPGTSEEDRELFRHDARLILGEIVLEGALKP